jgi:hypothetical protein
MSVRRVSVRYDRAEGEFTMQCETCASAGQTKSHWPLTLEFWNPTSGLQSCRACHNLARRKARRQTPEQRREKQRAYYWDHRDHRLAWRHAYHALHREEINRIRRLKYAAAKQQVVHQETLWELAADG